MRPEDRPAADLIPFIRAMGRAGKYNAHQQRLLGTAVALAIRYAPERQSLTVGDLERRLLEIENPFSAPGEHLQPPSLRAYKSRAKKALKDFFETSTPTPAPVNSSGIAERPPPESLSFRLPSGQSVEVQYPSGLGGGDLDALSRILRRLADLIQTQGQVLDKGEVQTELPLD